MKMPLRTEGRMNEHLSLHLFHPFSDSQGSIIDQVRVGEDNPRLPGYKRKTESKIFSKQIWLFESKLFHDQEKKI